MATSFAREETTRCSGELAEMSYEQNIERAFKLAPSGDYHAQDAQELANLAAELEARAGRLPVEKSQ